jgi:hypothetical protein
MKCFNCYSIHTNSILVVLTNKYIWQENKTTQLYMYSCYYCNNTYQTDLEKNYERHVILTHPKRPAYPSKVDLERLGIHVQGKRWEI